MFYIHVFVLIIRSYSHFRLRRWKGLSDIVTDAILEMKGFE